jgi:hypothetical protein
VCTGVPDRQYRAPYAQAIHASSGKRPRVKTVEAGSDDLELENKWAGSNEHYIAVFAKNSPWGILFHGFAEGRRTVKDTDGIKVQMKPLSFMKAFHSLL